VYKKYANHVNKTGVLFLKRFWSLICTKRVYRPKHYSICKPGNYNHWSLSLNYHYPTSPLCLWSSYYLLSI